MNDDSISRVSKQGALRSWIVAGCVLFVMLTLLTFVGEVSSIDIPPAAQKKAVSLNNEYVEAQRIFDAECGRCHKTPDPANQGPERTNCRNSLSSDNLSKVKNYMADVRKGKELYESHCGRCHELYTPESRTPDYWSKNLCTSDECFVKKLNDDEEQKLLLYLSSHAKKK